MNVMPEQPNSTSNSTLPENGTRVKATTLPSLEYDEEPEEIEGILTKIGSPFSGTPNCWVGSKEVDPSSVQAMRDEGTAIAPETGLAEG